MKAKLKVIKNWEFEEFELTGTSFKYSPTGCKGMVARSEDEIVFWTYHLVQKCSGVLWVKGEVSRWIPSPEPKEQQDVWEDPVLLSCDRGILLVCPASKSLWWMPQMDGEWIPIPMDNWCAQGIPKPVAVTGSQGVFPIVCRVDNSADATNSFTSLTVDFETMTAHWAESGSCVYSKAGTRQTHLAAVERAGGNFAQADFHYNYPMLSENKKRMVVAICAEEEISSIEWARLKKDKWVNRSISCPEYVQRIYKMMNWNKDCRYKVYGRLANSERGLVLVFDLASAVMFDPLPEEYFDKHTGKMKKRIVKYYPDEIRMKLGRSYSDYEALQQRSSFESLSGYMDTSGGAVPATVSEELAASISMQEQEKKRETLFGTIIGNGGDDDVRNNE